MKKNEEVKGEGKTSCRYTGKRGRFEREPFLKK